MANLNDKTRWKLTFQLDMDEPARDFFRRMDDEHKAREESINERIRQLFKEYVKTDGEVKDEDYNTVLNLFALGYQCGWNDNVELNNLTNENNTAH